MNGAPASVLLIKPSSLGDIVHAIPCAAALKRKWPTAKLSWVVNPEWAPIVSAIADETVLFPRNKFRGPTGWLAAVEWGRALGQIRPDIAIDLQGLLRSALIAKASRSGTIVGLSDAREGAELFYHTKIPCDRDLHAQRRYLGIAEYFEAPLTPLETPLPEGEPIPDLPKDFVLLHPYARGGGKSLSPEAIGAVCASIERLPVVLAGRSDDASEALKTLHRGIRFVNLVNQTSLLQMITLIRNASFVVSVDSGPMHIAAALTDRLLAIHTWSDPAKVGPANPKTWVWKNGQITRPMEAARKGAAQVHRSDAEKIGIWVNSQISSEYSASPGEA